MPLTRPLDALIQSRANARQLASARILIGINAVFASLEAFRMLQRVLAPAIVRIPFIPTLPALPRNALPAFIAISMTAALLFAIGWQTRFAGAVLTLATGYTLFMDQQTYSNHLYLLFLAILLLTIADSGAAWSVDARRHGAREDVAAWPGLLLKYQVTLVYFFSAMAKVTPQYLSGEILTRSLKQGGVFGVPLSWRSPELMSALAISSIVVELFIASGLWSRRLRMAAIGAGVAFHTMILLLVDSSRLSLAIFSLTMFAVYLLFLDPNRWKRWKSSAA
jgi:uncharacterized membrane protein YphA (DoxX/SURF4 family)